MRLPFVLHRSCIPSQRGFTLIEVLCYVSLIGVVVGAAIGVYALAAQNRITRGAIAEVEEQGSDTLSFIASRIAGASALATPVPGLPSSTLILVMNDPAKNPTRIELVSTTLRIKEGAGASIQLTTGAVRARSLRFTSTGSHLSSPTVQIEFTLEHPRLVSGNLPPYQATFYAATTIHP